MLNVSVETDHGTAGPLQTTMQTVTPGLFSVDGSGQGQGLASLSGTSLLATSRSYWNTGEPAEPDDMITILATGVGSPTNTLESVKIGPLPAPAAGNAGAQAEAGFFIPVDVDSVQAVPGHAGIYQIHATVPHNTYDGDAIPVVLRIMASDGSLVQSNTITVAIEPK